MRRFKILHWRSLYACATWPGVVRLFSALLIAMTLFYTGFKAFSIEGRDHCDHAAMVAENLSYGQAIDSAKPDGGEGADFSHHPCHLGHCSFVMISAYFTSPVVAPCATFHHSVSSLDQPYLAGETRPPATV